VKKKIKADCTFKKEWCKHFCRLVSLWNCWNSLRHAFTSPYFLQMWWVMNLTIWHLQQLWIDCIFLGKC